MSAPILVNRFEKHDRVIVGRSIAPIVEFLENRRLLSGGDVDSSFGVGGKLAGQVTLPTSSGLTAALGYDMAVQKDGQIVVAGSAQSSGHTVMLVVRFNSNGTIDNTFNGDGIVPVDFGSGVAATANCVRVDPFGRIVVAGSVSTPGTPLESFAVARITAAGKLDTTFSGDGRATVDFGQQAAANGLAVMSDGRVVVGGFTMSGAGSGQFAVARFTVGGSLDTGFSVDGKQTIDIDTGNDVANAVAVMADGRVVLGGYVTHPDGNRDMAVVRLTSSGQLDKTFDGNGIADVDFNGGPDEIDTLLITSGGKIVAAGRAGIHESPGVWWSPVAMAQFTDSGALDTSFSGDGKVTDADWFGGPLWEVWAGMPLNLTTDPAGGYRIEIHGEAARIRADGTLDKSFAKGSLDESIGVLDLTNNYSYFGMEAQAFVTNPDGSMLVLENQLGSLQVLHLNADGSLTPDSKKFDRGIITLPESSFTGAVAPTGQLVVAGLSERDYLFYRYNSNGTRDMSFGTSGFAETGTSSPGSLALPSVVVQGDGHAIGYGSEINIEGEIAIRVRRVNSNGSWDQGYAFDSYWGSPIGTGELTNLSGGYVFITVGDSHSNSALLIAPDGRQISADVPSIPIGGLYPRPFTDAAFPVGTTGKIVVAGTNEPYDNSIGDYSGVTRPIVARYLADGSLDTSFNGTGYMLDLTGVVGAQADGKILLRAGATGLKRLNSSGSKDSTFGTAGVAASGYATFDFDNLGRIIARKTLSNGDVQIARFTPDGKVDTTFGGGDGVVVVHPTVSSGAITLLITPNNDLVLTSLKETTTTAQWFATKLKGGGFADIASGKSLIVSGSAGNDTISVSATSSTTSVKLNGATQTFSKSAVSSIRVNGFGGDDTISVGNGVGNVVLDGGDGNDVLFGGNGNDTLIGGRGSDILSGGGGNDTADYSASTANLVITLDNVANDGVAGENDNVRDDVENVIGGSGNDKITGSSANNILRGGKGNDSLYGGGGADALFGNDGNDLLDGGAGDDYLEGGAGNDTLTGGSGHDKLYGQDGNDMIYAKDGQTDTLDGGTGTDKAQRDNTSTIKDSVLNIESFI